MGKASIQRDANDLSERGAENHWMNVEYSLKGK